MANTRRTQRRSQELDPQKVAEALLDDRTVEHDGWLIRIDASTDEVQVFPPEGDGFSAHLGYLDQAIERFIKKADMPIPAVNETQGDQVKLPGSANEILGEDSASKEPKGKFAPEINKRPKGTDQKGTSKPNTDLGEDSTDRNPKNFDPPINKRPQGTDPEGTAVSDPALGADTSSMPVNWRDRVVKIREDGKNSRREAYYESDEAVAVELYDYAKQDGDIYRQVREPVETNLAKKVKAGVYDVELAPRAFMYVVDAAAKKYAEEFGGNWYENFPPNIRQMVAENMAADWYDEHMLFLEGEEAPPVEASREALHEVQKPKRGPGQLGVGKAQMGQEAAPMVDGSDGGGDGPAAPAGGAGGGVGASRNADTVSGMTGMLEKYLQNFPTAKIALTDQGDGTVIYFDEYTGDWGTVDAMTALSELQKLAAGSDQAQVLETLKSVDVGAEERVARKRANWDTDEMYRWIANDEGMYNEALYLASLEPRSGLAGELKLTFGDVVPDVDADAVDWEEIAADVQEMSREGRRNADEDPFNRPVVEEPGKKPNKGETPSDPEEVTSPGAGDIDNGKREEKEGDKTGRIQDTFTGRAPDPDSIYRDLRRARPSEDLLRDITDPDKWAANNVFMPPKKALYEVVVNGNESVLQTDSLREAEDTYSELIEHAEEGFESMGGASIQLYEDGTLVDQWGEEPDIDERDVFHGDPEFMGLEASKEAGFGQFVQEMGKGIVNDLQNLGGMFGIGEGGLNNATLDMMRSMDSTPENRTYVLDAYNNNGGDYEAFAAELYNMFGGVDDPNIDWDKLSTEIFNQLDAQATTVEGRRRAQTAPPPQGAQTAPPPSAPVQAEGDLEADAPKGKGWERLTKDLKDEPDVDNPFALANWMKGEGHKPKEQGGGKESRREARPRLREDWGNEGGYKRDLEAETAEELHALTMALGGEEVDWSPFRPQDPVMGSPEENEGVVEQPGVADVQAGRDERPFVDSRREAQEIDLLERWINGNRKDVVAQLKDDPMAALNFITELPPEDQRIFITLYEQQSPNVNELVARVAADEEAGYKKGEEEGAGGEVEALDEKGQQYYEDYFAGDYGKQLAKGDVTEKGLTDTKKKPKIKDEKGHKARRAAWLRARRIAQAQAPLAQMPGAGLGAGPIPASPLPGAGPATPTLDPGSAGAPATTPGAPGAAPPKPAVPAAPGGAPAGLPAGVGDQGLQALGWLPDDIALMDEADKKKILEIQLTKPGTKKKPEGPGQEQKPGPGAPAAPKVPGAPPTPAGPGAVPPGGGAQRPQPAAPAPVNPPIAPNVAQRERMALLIQRKINRRKVIGQAAAPQPAAPAPAPAPTAPPAPGAAAPAAPGAPTPAAPKPGAPAAPMQEFGGKPPGAGAAPDAEHPISDEERAFEILSEVQEMEVSATTPDQVTSIKSSELARRLLTELGMTLQEARSLFGLANNKGFSSLLQ